MDYNQRAQQAIEPQNKVGRVARLYGKEGQLVVQCRDGFPDKPTLLWTVADGIGVPLWVRSCANQGMSKVVIVFEDFETEELSEQLLTKELYLEGLVVETEEPEGLELLVGFAFTDRTSTRTGRIQEAYESEMNPLLGVVLEGEQEERLVPWAEDLLVSLDEKKKKVVMALPDSFFEEFD